MPNPIKHADDIMIFTNPKTFYVLAGVNDSLDKELRDLLNKDPLPILVEKTSSAAPHILRFFTDTT